MDFDRSKRTMMSRRDIVQATSHTEAGYLVALDSFGDPIITVHAHEHTGLPGEQRHYARIELVWPLSMTAEDVIAALRSALAPHGLVVP